MTTTMFAGVPGWQLIHISSNLNQPSQFSYFASINTFDICCPTVLATLPHSSKCSSLTCSDVADDIVPICFKADTNGDALDSTGYKQPLTWISMLCKTKNIHHTFYWIVSEQLLPT